MTQKRKKLLLREDEAKMIEFALGKVIEGVEIVEKEYNEMLISAFSVEDKRKYRIAAKNMGKVAAETKRILKLVQDAEVTETVAEL